MNFKSLKTVGEAFRSPWKVLEFYLYLPVWTLIDPWAVSFQSWSKSSILCRIMLVRQSKEKKFAIFFVKNYQLILKIVWYNSIHRKTWFPMDGCIYWKNIKKPVSIWKMRFWCLCLVCSVVLKSLVMFENNFLRKGLISKLKRCFEIFHQFWKCI